MDPLKDLLSLPPEIKITLFDQLSTFLLANVSAVSQPAISTKKTSSIKYDYVTSLAPEDVSCFNKLKIWRNQAAKDLDLAPYMVLDNKTLMTIAHYKPISEEDLLKIKGIGQEKLGKYSDTVLGIVKASSTTYERKLPKTSAPAPSSGGGSMSQRFLKTNHLEFIEDE